MINKAIAFLLRTQDELENFGVRTRVEVEKYSNKQIKKAGIVCFLLGLALGISL